MISFPFISISFRFCCSFLTICHFISGCFSCRSCFSILFILKGTHHQSNHHEEARATTQRRKPRDTTLLFLTWFNLKSCDLVTLFSTQVTKGERQHHATEANRGRRSKQCDHHPDEERKTAPQQRRTGTSREATPTTGEGESNNHPKEGEEDTRRWKPSSTTQKKVKGMEKEYPPQRTLLSFGSFWVGYM